ncbi:MAG: glycosyltransferase, partial [Candidatus Eisenbacteria bacterium]|nr:glycosyltransferase [Candidatus Eisenbacteria bacterium]
MAASRLRRARHGLLACALSLFLLLLLPRLLSVGIFFDGLTYAAVARNLSLGIGSFWAPHYTQTIYPTFHEQPPLGLWMQSLLFRLFGDTPRVEAFYGLGAGLLLLLLMAGIWRAGPRRPRTGVWLPILLLAVYPLTSWILASNMLEITMALWTAAAVWIALRAVRARRPRTQLLGGMLAGCLTAGALLTKGPV